MASKISGLLGSRGYDTGTMGSGSEGYSNNVPFIACTKVPRRKNPAGETPNPGKLFADPNCAKCLS